MPRAAFRDLMDYPIWNDFAALGLTVALVLIVFL
jgi:hypothetical protein